jgi:predicted acylesterase/phospholipase RssA
MAAALVAMAPLVAMTFPAGAESAPHKKPPIAQKIAPKPPTPAERPAFNAEDEEHAIIPGIPDARFWGDSEKGFLQATRGAVGPWLALSAGGADGAFGAGLLVGLSASGQRPDFTVVTGVSTGALMAPFAFVGARQDETLRKIYTTINAGDIFEMAQTRDSLLDTWPLRKTIEKQVTPQLLDEVAAEHRKGRRLFVLTTNIDSGRPVVWNMGVIAAHGGDQALTLFRQVLLASASLPGVFPPVYIDVESADGKAFREMHGDGGIYAQFYIAPESTLARGAGLPATDLYVIVNGKLSSDFAMTDQGALTILARSISVATTTAMRGQMLQGYFAAQRQQIGFHVAMVAPSFMEENQGPFDTVSMKALFDFGMKQGQGASPFLTEPPGLPNAITGSRAEATTTR